MQISKDKINVSISFWGPVVVEFVFSSMYSRSFLKYFLKIQAYHFEEKNDQYLINWIYLCFFSPFQNFIYIQFMIIKIFLGLKNVIFLHSYKNSAKILKQLKN